MTDDKHTIHEKIEVLMVSHNSYGAPITTSIDYKRFIDRLNELYEQNMHKSFVSFCVELVKDSDLGWGLLFSGQREETKEEADKREAIETAKKKALEDSELQQYIKLHKKYGRKGDSQG